MKMGNERKIPKKRIINVMIIIKITVGKEKHDDQAIVFQITKVKSMVETFKTTEKVMKSILAYYSYITTTVKQQ